MTADRVAAASDDLAPVDGQATGVETTTCIRCGRIMEPIHMSGRCDRALDGGGCEPPHPLGGWLASRTVRQGSTTHAPHCERSATTVWLPPDLPCSCATAPRHAASDGGPTDGD